MITPLSCQNLAGVGPKILAALATLNLSTILELLFHLPLRYEDRTHLTPIKELQPGQSAALVGTLTALEVSHGRQQRLLCWLNDGTGQLLISFFNFHKQKLQFRLKPGTRLYCYGDVRYGLTTLEMTHPEYRILQPHEAPPVTNTLTAIYPTTQGLSQTLLRKLIAQALNLARQNQLLTEYLPENLRRAAQFPELLAALEFVHQPQPTLNLATLTQRSHPARQRLIFEELLAWQLSLLKLRQQLQTHRAPPISYNHEWHTKILATLPFTLTQAQQRVLAQIFQDLGQAKPMLRLIQGDVGSGKTIVAALALLQVVQQGLQAAVLAPTEILAHQHFNNLTQWLAPLQITPVLLTGATTLKVRRDLLAAIAKGQARVIVGTHAIFQEALKFQHLALVIIDEQHRFGVHQRLQLRDKGRHGALYPHQLIMTATPIPRTLAMTLYADLDCAIIDELPKGRAPITTILVANRRRSEVIAQIRNNCQQAKQAYWVCPLIEESEQLQAQAAQSLAIELTNQMPEVRIGLLHGRLKNSQKTAIMAAFKNHELDLLVATTVIEVGVDVPNASLMVLENAERLGLAQLHQLRGRIGRGSEPSYCTLMYQEPLGRIARERLTFLRNHSDGFAIARKDLELRGAGEILGTRQTGLLQLRIASLLEDQDLIPQVQQTAGLIWHQYPDHVEPLIARWLGSRTQYGDIG